MDERYIILGLMPLVSGAIGWFTNFVAVKMLLHPIQPKKILGITFQGLLPRRHGELARRISKAIAKDFLTEQNVIEFIKSANTEVVLKEFIKKKWDEKIDDILSVVPMVQMFLSPEKLHEIRDKIADTFSKNSGDFATVIGESLSGKVDLQTVIEKNILAFDLERLENIIEEIANKEFRYIERLGGVIGLLIGVVQSALVYFVFGI